MAIPRRVKERLRAELKKYVKVLEAQRKRDVSEADTVTVCKDVLGDVFGYDKYAEITGEQEIRGKYCDLAIKIDDKIRLLIEVKAIGIKLNERHLDQAVSYSANQGIDWVILTNGIEWKLYHMIFQKPIDKEEVMRINLLDVNTRSESEIEKLYVLTREGITKNALSEFRDRKDATSRFMLAAILTGSDSVVSAIRREVRSVSDMLIDPEVIEKVLREQVIKREALEGDQAVDAKRRLTRSTNQRKKEKSQRKSKTKTPVEPPDSDRSQTSSHLLPPNNA